MIRTIKLIDYLPLFLQQYKEIYEIMTAENPEFQLTADESERIKNNQFIQLCDAQGIKKFESLLGLYPAAGETLQSRISNVMLNWNDKTPYTEKVLIERIAQYAGPGMEYDVTIYNEEYKLDVSLDSRVSEKLDEVNSIVQDMIPANLIFSLYSLIKPILIIGIRASDYPYRNYNCGQELCGTIPYTSTLGKSRIQQLIIKVDDRLYLFDSDYCGEVLCGLKPIISTLYKGNEYSVYISSNVGLYGYENEDCGTKPDTSTKGHNDSYNLETSVAAFLYTSNFASCGTKKCGEEI